MPDFGIGEAIAAIGSLFATEAVAAPAEAAAGAGLFGGAEAAGAGAGLFGEAATAGGLSSGFGLADALGTTAGLGIEGGAVDLGGIAGFGAGTGEAAGAIGSAAPLAFTVNALPGAEAAGAAAGGFGIGDAIGALGAGIGGLLGPSSAAAGTLTPGAIPGSATAGAAPGAGGPTSTIDVNSLMTGTQPTGAGASGFAPAPGVQLPAGVSPDATSAAALNPPTPDAFSAPGSSATFPPPAQGSTPIQNITQAFQDLGGTGGGATPVPTQSITPGAPAGGASLDQIATNASVAQGAGGAGAGAPTSLAPPGTGAGAAGASPSLLNQIGSSVMKNPLGLAIGAGGLGYSILQGQKQSKAQKALESEAAPLLAQSQELSSFISSGRLPPGLQASLDQATASAKATAVANAAGRGLPTDPRHNTALAAELASIDRQAPIVQAQIAQQLLTAGVQEAGLSSQIYQQLANLDMRQTESIGRAIANMAAALNTGGTRIQIGGTTNT